MSKLINIKEIKTILGAKTTWYVVKKITETCGEKAIIRVGYKTILIKESDFKVFLKKEERRLKNNENKK